MIKIINNKTISLRSFKPDGYISSYQLQQIEEPIIQKLKATIEKLDTLPQVCLCARGHSFSTQEQHDNFIEQDCDLVILLKPLVIKVGFSTSMVNKLNTFLTLIPQK